MAATGFSYIVLGAGKQGLAAAYDVLLFGGAARLTLADQSLARARQGISRLRHLLASQMKASPAVLRGAAVDASRGAGLRRLIKGHDAVLSALPYVFNPDAAAAAIASRAHYCDLGGYFETTRKIRALDARARKAGVALVPDCGVSPGLCNSLAVCGMEQLAEVRDVVMYCGGLPQTPRPPLDYKIVFNLKGLLGNYFGKAYVLRDGEVRLLDPLSEPELLDFDPPLGQLEAAVTGGATSTCPWTFQGRVRNYTYKTLRYPGHFDKIRLLKELGLLETDPVAVDGKKIVPRDFFSAVAEPRLRFPDDRDLLVLRVLVRGEKDGRGAEIVYDVFDKYDPATGFTAMQRTTGFSAAIVLEALAQGKIEKRGAVPLELALPGAYVAEEIRRRGIPVRETIRFAEAAA
jgi:lysine 6-dehydrogenase